MSVRGNIDQLLAEPAVADLGYPADQRMVATLFLGLTLLADAIDEIEARLAETTQPLEVVQASAVPPDMHDLTAEIRDITQQVGKLAKIIKKAAKEK
jgi:precorrin-4 methylase